MKIEDKLEIVIPTFNRCEKLGITFSYLLDENSPVKNCDITILDDCSTDDTPNLVKKIAEKHPNVRYRCNMRNLGILGNILNAHLICSKEYFWLLGDNDTYDFSCFKEVEEAIENETDAIIVVSLLDHSRRPKDLRSLVIAPGGWDYYPFLILKTSNFTRQIYRLMEVTLSRGYAWIFRGVLLINQKPDFKVIIVKKSILKWIHCTDKPDKVDIQFLLPDVSMLISILMSIEDKKLLKEVLTTFFFQPMGFLLRLYACRRREWLCFFVFPWKWKIYFLVVGHCELFKRILQKLIHLDFSIKKLNL